MNPLQMALQIRHKLQTVTWPGGGRVVFGEGGVSVVAGTPTEEQIPPGFPWAMVIIGTGTADPDSPDLLEQTYTIVTAVEVAGDPLGEFAIIGGARPDREASAGAGIGEVAARTRAAVEKLTGADGATVQLSTSSIGNTATLGRGRHLAMDELVLTAVCTSAPYYAPPQQLARSGATWEWVGDHCIERADFVQFRLGYRAGTLPPETPEDADAIVYTGVEQTATVTAVPSATYVCWADYSSRGWTATAIEGSSSGSEVGAYLRAGSSGFLPSSVGGASKCTGCQQEIDTTTDPFPSFVTIEWQGEPRAHGKCKIKTGTLTECETERSCSFNGTLTINIDFEDGRTLKNDGVTHYDYIGSWQNSVSQKGGNTGWTDWDDSGISSVTKKVTGEDNQGDCEGSGDDAIHLTITILDGNGDALPGEARIYCSECEYTEE